MRSAAGATTTRATPSTRAARCPTARPSTASAELRAALLADARVFAGTFTEKLLTYALGRGLAALRHARRSWDTPRSGRRRISVRVDRARHRSTAGDAVHDAARDRGGSQMFVTQKALPRRTVLRGLGIAIALPFLEAMVPAMTALAQGGAPPLRFGAVYVPNGCPIDYWMPSGAAGELAITPILQPLEPFRSQLTVIGNLSRAGGTARHGPRRELGRLVERRGREANRSRGHPRRRDDRSSARRSTWARTRRSRRSSSRPRISRATSAAACRATAART